MEKQLLLVKKHAAKQWVRILAVFLLGLVIWFYPHSPELQPKAWHLFAIFMATIVGIILKPVPIGAIAVISMSFSIFVGVLPLELALGSFSNDIVWLVLFAFFIAKAFIKTGLGNRLAYGFVALFGKKTLGLSYGLLLSEFILAPAIPSVTARSGGVIFPIVQGLAKSYGSDPILRTEKRIGTFLTNVAYQGSVICSAMFLTAMAANPLIATLTAEAGFTLTWGKWALAALVPGLLSLILMPLIVYRVSPPEIRDTPHATQLAREKLQEMGAMKLDEWFMLGTFILLLVLWIFGGVFGIKASTAAMVGVSILLLFRVIDWKDVLREENAWDTFIWFGTLIMLASTLNKYGFTPWFSEQIVEGVSNFHWVIGLSILVLVYFYTHYFFASNTAHVGAMYPAFLLVALGLGAPPFLAIALLAFSSSLFGGLTHYGTGPAPIFYGSGYVDIKTWWKLGAILSVVNLLIWGGIGTFWWKFLGFW